MADGSALPTRDAIATTAEFIREPRRVAGPLHERFAQRTDSINRDNREG